MIKKTELVARLQAGETLKEYFRDGDCNGFVMGNETVHGRGAKQLVESGQLERTENSHKVIMGREWQWKQAEPAPQVESSVQPLSDLHARIAQLQNKLLDAQEVISDLRQDKRILKEVEFKLEGDLLGQTTLAQLRLGTITKLEGENARMKAALEKIEGITPSGDMPALGTNAYTAWFAGNLARKALQAQAPASVAEQVTLTDSEIEWLAEHLQGATFVFELGALPDSLYPKTKPSEALRYRGNGKLAYTMLEGRHNSKVNWDTIEAKRQSLKAQS